MVISTPTPDDLLRLYGDFCRRHGMAESTFGLKMMNDGNLFAQLRDGRELTMRSLRRIAAGMEAYEAQLPDAA